MLLCSILCFIGNIVIIISYHGMGGQHDGLFLSGSPPILYIYIHMYIFLMAKSAAGLTKN